MLQKKRARHQQSPRTKSSQIKKQIRHKQLDQQFSYMRKRALHERDRLWLDKISQKQFIAIETLVNDLNSQKQDVMFNLWQQCYTYSYRYFSVEHINTILEKLKKYSLDLKSYDQQILMGVWLIANWTFTSNLSHFYSQELLDLFLSFLQKTNHQKLSQYILFSLSNLCQNGIVGVKLMEIDIIDRILNCSIAISKLGDVAAVLKRIIKTLLKDYHYSQHNIQQLVNFLKYVFPRVQDDDYLRGDCIFILVKIMLANSCCYKLEIMHHLEQSIKQMIKGIQNLISLRSLQDMFFLLANIYSNPFSQDSLLFDSQFQVFVWQFSRRLLEGYPYVGFAEDKRVLVNLFGQLWMFLDNFLQHTHRNNSEAIIFWLKNQCEQLQSLQWQEQSLGLLVKHIQNDQLFELCEKKLRNFTAIDHLVEAMLKAIQQNLRDFISVKDIEYRQELIEAITQMKYDEREFVAELAMKIVNRLDQQRGNQGDYSYLFGNTKEIVQYLEFQEKTMSKQFE